MNKILKNKKGFTLIRGSYSGKTGFTLIELLIVIAVLGTLAVVVLIALNPVQQLARTRDAGRTSSVTQLGRIIQAYATTTATYPAAATWMQDLVDAGEIDGLISPVAYQITTVAECGTNTVNTFCYDINGDDFIVFARAEADANINQCGGDNAYFVYSSNAGRGGIVCNAGDPAAPVDAGDFLN